MNKENLIFVYNAGSGLFSTVTDFAHKILSPSTYECQLCALTYGSFSMKQEWKSFIESLPIKTVFLHKDEFLKKYGKQKTEFPAIFIDKGNSMEVLVQDKIINACISLKDLEQVITAKLNSLKK